MGGQGGFVEGAEAVFEDFVLAVWREGGVRKGGRSGMRGEVGLPRRLVSSLDCCAGVSMGFLWDMWNMGEGADFVSEGIRALLLDGTADTSGQ